MNSPMFYINRNTITSISNNISMFQNQKPHKLYKKSLLILEQITN
jgi:hypothetical protein